MADARPVRRIARFVDDPASGDFDELARDAFAFQLARIPPYRRLCERRGVLPQRLTSWREIPPVPSAAFRSLVLHAAPPREVFRSSGTSGGPRSVHHHPFPGLYRKVIDASFPAFCLPGGGRAPMLSLVPSRRQLPDSSLGFMVDHLLRRFGTRDSVTAFGGGGVDAAAADTACRRWQAAGRPVVVLATAFALVRWLEALEAAERRFALPAGSTVFETGGFKGRVREVARGELLERLGERLGVPPEKVVREYGMTELTSQLYTRVLAGGDPELFVAPHWVRLRLLDPRTLDETPAGTPGVVALFDLANIGSALHLLTEDLGVAEPGGLRLLGRAAGAALRGCSLTVEELETAAGDAAR